MQVSHQPMEENLSDFPHLHRTHHTSGYRDGLAEARDEISQPSFNAGLPLGKAFGARVGKVLGILEFTFATVKEPAAQALLERAKMELSIAHLVDGVSKQTENQAAVATLMPSLRPMQIPLSHSSSITNASHGTLEDKTVPTVPTVPILSSEATLMIGPSPTLGNMATSEAKISALSQPDFGHVHIAADGPPFPSPDLYSISTKEAGLSEPSPTSSYKASTKAALSESVPCTSSTTTTRGPITGQYEGGRRSEIPPQVAQHPQSQEEKPPSTPHLQNPQIGDSQPSPSHSQATESVIRFGPSLQSNGHDPTSKTYIYAESSLPAIVEETLRRWECLATWYIEVKTYSGLQESKKFEGKNSWS